MPRLRIAAEFTLITRTSLSSRHGAHFAASRGHMRGQLPTNRRNRGRSIDSEYWRFGGVSAYLSFLRAGVDGLGLFAAPHQAGHLVGLGQPVHALSQTILIAMFPRAEIAIGADSNPAQW